MTNPYPRDMIGYGAEPPHAQWPGDARIALQFVINYEEGAENAIIHGDPAAEAFLSEWMGATPTLGLRNMNMESLYEYGSRAGFWRLYRTFTERGLPVTVGRMGDHRAAADQRCRHRGLLVGAGAWRTPRDHSRGRPPIARRIGCSSGCPPACSVRRDFHSAARETPG